MREGKSRVDEEKWVTAFVAITRIGVPQVLDHHLVFRVPYFEYVSAFRDGHVAQNAGEAVHFAVSETRYIV